MVVKRLTFFSSASLATFLGIIAFRGVGAVGTREPKLVSPEEASGGVEKTQHDTTIETTTTITNPRQTQ
jgi:hypothetical protein